MPLGSLLCALWTACVAGRRRCSGGFCPASTSPPPTHFWLPPCHTKARGAGLPQFVVMCMQALVAGNSFMLVQIAGSALGHRCLPVGPAQHMSDLSGPYMQCVFVATFLCRLLAPSSHCMVTFDVNLLTHVFLGHAVD